MNQVLLDERTESKVFQEKWETWKDKINTVVSQNAKEHVVGGSYDDLISLARQVLLRVIRTHRPEQTRFSTYFYTCLNNALADNMKKLSTRVYWHIKYPTASGRTMRYTFISPRAVRKFILKNKIENVEITFTPIARPKQIPRDLITNLQAFHHVIPEGPTPIDIEPIFSAMPRYLPDQTDGEIVRLLYQGFNVSSVIQKLELNRYDLKRRLLRIRRATVRAARDRVVLV